MIICSGFNVYPRNIEEAIYRHPSVEEERDRQKFDAYWHPAQGLHRFIGAQPLSLDAGRF
jgi:long-chain acyl-CoA synthetase